MHRGTKIRDLKKGKKRQKRHSRWRQPIQDVPIATKIEANDVLVTSLAECLRRYGANKKTSILVGTVLEVEIGPKANALGRRRTFVVAKLDLGGG